MRLFGFLIVAAGLLASLAAIDEDQVCFSQDTCERCLTASFNCAWCTDKEYDKRYRCLTRSRLIEWGCNESSIYTNEPDLEMLEDTPLKDYETVDDQAVQVQPQNIYIKLVKSHTQRLKFSYRPARNNPLDLYMLMDLTWSMRDDKETLTTLGAELAKTLGSLTPNYKLGFGSFADKPIMPMVLPQAMANPCAAERGVCAPTYGFKHHLQLTDNITTFIDSVKASEITGNLDNLEGGLDALMQVLVCNEEIGWRPEARKVVILVTDGFMHFAGDGLLAGITRPNDKKCHLDEKGDYLGSLVYDYPSLEEIYRELVKRKINVIFAVTANVVNTYQEFSGLMKDISNVEMLTTDSSNILELIKKSYESFIKRTQFTDDSPSFIELKYETDCGGQYPSLRPRNYCNNLETGKTVDFYIDVTLKEFPKDGVYKHKIRIEESSLEASLEIQVEIQQPCPCSEGADPNHEYGRFQCNENGYLNCGMCTCDEGWTGTFCSCPTDPLNATTNEFIENLCRKPNKFNSDLGPICSNNGYCDCGICSCDDGWSGTYCECPQCSSFCDPEVADCICGVCYCRYGKVGTRCNCKEEPEKCVAPNGEICSNHGHCKCGQCVCDAKFKGRYCEIDGDKENKLCAFYEPCVTCHIEQKLGTGFCKNLNEVCETVERTERYTFRFVDKIDDTETKCLIRLTNELGDICDHYFTYNISSSSDIDLTIEVNKCEPINMLALIGRIGSLTFFLALFILLAVFCYFKRKDRLEYERFVQQAKEAFNQANMQNPIYKNPIHRYSVPAGLQEETHLNPFR